MVIPFVAWVFQGIPESLAIVTFVVLATTKELNWQLIARIAIIYAIGAYLIRYVPLTPGVHVIVLISFLAFITTWLGKTDIRASLTYSILIVILLVLIEICFNLLIVGLGITTVDMLRNNNFQRIVFGLPQVFIIFLVSYFYKRRYIKPDNAPFS